VVLLHRDSELRVELELEGSSMFERTHEWQQLKGSPCSAGNAALDVRVIRAGHFPVGPRGSMVSGRHRSST
jgi:hypothetical protein